MTCRPPGPFVAYFRVSTDRQGARGLGMDAQRSAVARYLAGHPGALLAEFVEVESGRRRDRPQLASALAAARAHRAVLVIAKLDRLARNVHFISGLMESGVEFVAVDMPHANRLTLHILAAVAEHEREMISQRTKAALTAARARGTRLGRPKGVDLSGMRAHWSERTARFADSVRPIVTELRGRGLSLRRIAAELNRRGIATCHGRQWRAQQVSRLVQGAA